MRPKITVSHGALVFSPAGVALLWMGLLAPASSSLAATPDGRHPRLVSAASARCDVCHNKLLRDAEHVHEVAADDCTTCHDVDISEAGTRITLVDTDPNLCLTCHAELEAAVAGELEASHLPVEDSCLTCHDPHASNEPALLTMPVTELCTACHDAEDLLVGHSGQITATTSCTRCHTSHGSDRSHMLAGSVLHAPFEDRSCDGCHREPFGGRMRLRARGDRLCSACHGDLAEEAGAEGSVHAAIHSSRQAGGCVDCHDPHMSNQASLLIMDSQSLCGTCHAEILAASTAETGHMPAAEECLTCHLPHASTEKHLLLMPASELCVNCHDTDDEDVIAAHLGADVASLDCTGCHTPHGAGHAGLLAVHLHAPILDGCDTCHEGSASQILEDGESLLCLACHDDIGTQAEQAAVVHPAMEAIRCADCHNPHASPHEALLIEPAGGVCTPCHDEHAAAPDEHAHSVIDSIGCRACHEPHGGEHGGLLRRQGADLCLSCHDPDRVRVDADATTITLLDRFELPVSMVAAMTTLRLSADGLRNHPVPRHRVLGQSTKEELRRVKTTFKGELFCLTCHDPHKGRSNALLRWNALLPSEACVQCHPN